MTLDQTSAQDAPAARRAWRRDHQAVDISKYFAGVAALERRQRRVLRGRSARHPRRERRRQVHADEHHLRRVAAGARARSTSAIGASRRCRRRPRRRSAFRSPSSIRPCSTISRCSKTFRSRCPRRCSRADPPRALRAAGAGRRRPARAVARARRRADRRAKTSAGNRQGAGDQAQGADPRRADRLARPGCDRHAVRPHPRPRQVGHVASSTSPTGSRSFARSPSGSRCCATGKVRGVARVDEIGDADLLNLIVGRTLGSAFPPKSQATSRESRLRRRGAERRQVLATSASRRARGQIFGVAGVAGNGQSELMRALAGLQPSQGAIRSEGPARSPPRTCCDEAAFMPSDRHTEGLAGSLTVRENATFAALDKFADLRRARAARRRCGRSRPTFQSLAVKTAGLEAPILSLSGGNQQKVVMARALLSEPGLIVADEPTQGVDVGARFEIYRILREVSSSGTPVIVNSSDAAELEGLCDKVIVLSRGRVVGDAERRRRRRGQDRRRRRPAPTPTSATATSRRDARSARWRLAALPAIGQRAGRSAGARHGAARPLRLQPEREFLFGVQRLQHPHAGDGAGLHRARADRRAADGRHRPFGRTAGGLPGRHRVVLHQRGQVRGDDRGGLRADVRRRLRRRRRSTAC